MQKEIIAVIMTSAATLFVTIYNVSVSKKISSKQNEIELKKTRIHLLESRRLAIERVNSELKNIQLGIKPNDLMDLTLSGPKMIEHYRKRADLFLSIGHFFSDDINQELIILSNDINNNIIKVAQNINITNEDAQIIISRMSSMNSKIENEISNKLQKIENHIQKLLE